MRIRRIESILFAIALASTSAVATRPDANPRGHAEIPNWQAPRSGRLTPQPRFRTPAAVAQDAKAAALAGVLAPRTPLIITQPTPLTFIPITPCRGGRHARQWLHGSVRAAKPPGKRALFADAAVGPLGTGANAGQITVVNESANVVDLFFDVNAFHVQ